MRNVLIAAILVFGAAALTAQVTVSHAIALHGEPKYDPDFTHFDYVNPDAPKGGTLRYHSIGTFDSFNRYAQRGDTPAGSETIYDSLMVSSDDEIDSLYPLVAETIEYPADYSYVIFTMNPAARFQDGRPIRADDVVFTVRKFLEEGVEFIQTYIPGTTGRVIDELTVRFDIPDGDREKIMYIASFPILPPQYWADRDFSEPTTEVPLGSGAYTISDYKMGQYVVYKRLEDYWAKDLPVNRGKLNFDFIRYDYYRDENVAFEAFKAGEYDFYLEGIAKNWATLHGGPNYDQGYIIKEEIPHEIPENMQAFVFNIQQPFFSDRRVRQALNLALDFQWMNKNLFYDQYTRTRSYFQNTEYEAKGVPSAEELEILEPIRDKIPEEVFTEEYNPPVTDGSGNIRPQIREALKILKEAGWEIREIATPEKSLEAGDTEPAAAEETEDAGFFAGIWRGIKSFFSAVFSWIRGLFGGDSAGGIRRLVNIQTGEPLEFELINYSPSSERVIIPLQQNLERMGITLNIRTIDPTQYLNRLRDRDFDMISQGFAANAIPGSGLLLRWHSDYIDSSYNQAGVEDDAVDYLLEGIVDNQNNLDALLYWGRALDRVLTWNHYVIPQWHLSKFRVSYWDKFSRPETRPKYTLGLDTWWIDTEKAAKLPDRVRQE